MVYFIYKYYFFFVFLVFDTSLLLLSLLISLKFNSLITCSAFFDDSNSAISLHISFARGLGIGKDKKYCAMNQKPPLSNINVPFPYL